MGGRGGDATEGLRERIFKRNNGKKSKEMNQAGISEVQLRPQVQKFLQISDPLLGRWCKAH